MALTLALPFASCRRPPQATVTAEVVTLNNRGVALMGQFDFDAAAAAFDALRTRQPGWPGARLNHAIALVNRQGPEDAADAEAELRPLLDVPEVDRRARYVLALLLAHEGRDEEAWPLLVKVADADPPDGFAAYFAAQQRLTTAPAEALAWYEKAAAREPLLRSAYYGAFLSLRRLGRDAEAKDMLARFQDLERNPQSRVAEFKYTRMGPLSEVVTVDLAVRLGGDAPSGPRFQPPAPLLANVPARWKPAGRRRSTTIADLDGDGSLDVFVTDALEGSAANAIVLNRNATWTLDVTHSLASVPGVRAAIWGDFDDDGLADVVLCRESGGTTMWRQESAGRFGPLAAPQGVRLPDTDIVDGAAFDADHDGDLDLWLVNGSGPSVLLNNDGGLRFRAIADLAGVGGDGRPARSLAVADLDGDRDTDVMVIKATPPHDVFLNDRVWTYRRDPGAADLVATPISALIAGDLDADGDIELYSASEDGIARWRRDVGGVWRAEPVARSAVGADAQLALADTNGDGRLELLATAETGWSVHEMATGVTVPAEAQDHSGTATPGGWTVAHLDWRAGPSVVGVGADGAPDHLEARPRTPRVSGSRLLGPRRVERSAPVECVGHRHARGCSHRLRWTAFDTTRLASGPGQSLQPMTIGLGGAARADFVALTWSDGVFQTEMGLEGGQLHRISETQRQLSSCPVLFAWDGSRFRFVTDVLGVGGIGFFERPGVYSEPLPRENVILPDGAVAESEGTYRLKIAEPMEEVAYLDAVSLVAYDLPPGWRVALDERKAVSGPAPSGAPIFYREERLPIEATDQTGATVTERLQRADLSGVGPQPSALALHRPRAAVCRDDDLRTGSGPRAGPGGAAGRWVGGVPLRADDVRGVAGWRGLRGADARGPRCVRPMAPGGARVRVSRRHAEADGLSAAAASARNDGASPAHVPGDLLGSCCRGLRGVAARRSAARAAHRGRRRWTRWASRAAPRDRSARPTTTTRAARRLADTRHPRGWYTEFGPVEALVAAADECRSHCRAWRGGGRRLRGADELRARGLDPCPRARSTRVVQGHGSLHARRRDHRAAPRRRHRRAPPPAPAIQYEVCGRVLGIANLVIC